MASHFFRKLTHGFATFGKKLGHDVGRFGSKLGHGADVVVRGINTAERAINKVAPNNPFTKTITGALDAVKGVSQGVGYGGQALNQLSHGHIQQAGQLGMQGLNSAKSGIASGVKTATTIAPFVV